MNALLVLSSLWSGTRAYNIETLVSYRHEQRDARSFPGTGVQRLECLALSRALVPI